MDQVNDIELEKQKAIAIAEAEVAANKEANPPPSWGSVLGMAPVKAAVGFADQVINTPENLYELGQVAYGTGATMLGRPDLAPEVNPTPSRLTNFMEEQNFFPNMENATPEQKVTDIAIQGATLGLASPASGLRQLATNVSIAMLSSAAGEKTAQVTGSPLAGLAVSVGTGAGASAIPGLQSQKRIMEATNKYRNETLKAAQNKGYVVVTEDRIADFADRPKLIQMADEVNQTITNNIAKEAVGLPRNASITPDGLRGIRQIAYQNGYLPLKKMGPVIADTDYMDDLNRIENNYSGIAGTFSKDVPKKLRTLVDNYRVANMDAGDIIDKVKQLRHEASMRINSDKPLAQQIGWAQKEIANAMENVLERQANFNGLPSNMIDAYKAARKQIAVTHVVEDAMQKGSGDIDINKLARAFQKGDYMDGDLEIAASFGNVNRPKPGQAKDSNMYWYTHAAGLSLGGVVASKLGLDWEYAAPIALAGGAITKSVHDKAAKPVRDYLMSSTGQKRSLPNYEEYGYSAKNAAASAFGYFQSEREE